MFVMNDDLSIYATRGDIVFFSVTADDNGILYKFQPGDIVRMAVYGKKEAESCVMQKDFPVTEVTEKVFIYLDEEDTKIGEIISKHKDYWYEVVLNPDTMPQTIIGYDEDGAKVFRLFPESNEIDDDYKPKEEDFPVVDSELDMTSPRPVSNSAIARAMATILDTCKRTNEAVAENFVTPEMYGAIGDGKADDTEAIQFACDSGFNIVLNKQYSITGTIEVRRSITIVSGAVVYVDADVDAFTMNGENLSICGSGTIQVRADNYSHTVVTMSGGCKRCSVEGISIKGIDPYHCYGTGVACITDSARLFLNMIHADIENFDIGILLDARNHWLNCFDMKSAVNYCNIGVKQIGTQENGYHTIDITGQACFYTEGGCGLYCDEHGGKCHYRLNIVDTGRVEGSVKYNTILAVIKSDNNCIEIPYDNYAIYLKNEGRKNRFLNEQSCHIAASDNILNNIDKKSWCKYEPINLDSLRGTSLFLYPKEKNSADNFLYYFPKSDNDGARIELTLPRTINPYILGIICSQNNIPKRIVVTFSSDDGTETAEIPSQVYEDGVFIPLRRYFTWKPLYLTKKITIECYGSNRPYNGSGVGLVGLMLDDQFMGGQLV
jgi:hypothetical protein